MQHKGLYSLSSPAFMGSLFMAALVAIVTPRGGSTTHGTEATAMTEAGIGAIHLPAFMQENYYAFLKIDIGGNESWPNDGTIPVIAYGWGGDRPLPARQRADSLNPIFAKSLKSPTLNFQKRDDIFSPILERMAGGDQTLPLVRFTVTPFQGDAITFNLYDVKIISMRDVGYVINENPTTQEVVLAFSRIEQAVDD